jgi:predicted negative regulator of RcsB-dependent stress response
LIWIKRLLPFAIIIIVWLAYGYYSDYKVTRKMKIDQKYARVTALVWVASAKYRNDAERFIKYRDSLLAADSLDIEKAQKYIDSYQKAPEELGVFTTLVIMHIDSLIAIEDSILTANKDSLSDTLTSQSKKIKLE